MMCAKTQTDGGEDETGEQAIDHVAATDAEEVREALPEDVRSNLTKRAFSPGALRKLLRDTFYMGPISIGTGGWIGMFGNGEPGTGMRRPNGALYNFPRSWRYAALERGLKTGLVTHVGGGSFAATERGVAVLRRIDRCPECGEERVPMVRSSYYNGNPNTEGHLESHELVTECPECGGHGYDYGAGVVSFDEYDRREERVEYAVAAIEDTPEARTFGGERDVRPEAALEEPDIDEESVEEVLTEHVENYTPPSPRDFAQADGEDLYGREVLPLETAGEHVNFYGTDDALVVKRASEEGDVHLTVEDEDERRLKVNMSYEVAVEEGAKDAIKGGNTDASWEGDYWTISADGLPRVASVLTGEWVPQHESEPLRLDVTATDEAVALVDVPVPGVDEDGEIAPLPDE